MIQKLNVRQFRHNAVKPTLSNKIHKKIKINNKKPNKSQLKKFKNYSKTRNKSKELKLKDSSKRKLFLSNLKKSKK